MAGGEEIRVFGLVNPHHVVEDIGITVPQGREVTIPAEQASRSRDLYKAIGQKKLFQLPSAPAPQYTAPPTHVRDDLLQERIHHLEVRNRQLEAENAQLREGLQAALAQKDGMNLILSAIENMRSAAPVAYSNGQVARQADEFADGAAPQYIPSEIAPKDASSHIDIVKQEGADNGVLDTLGNLRRLRRGGDAG